MYRLNKTEILFKIVGFVIAACIECESAGSYQRTKNCPEGEFWHQGLLTCQECLSCKPGEGVRFPCSTNTKCVKCIQGRTFSDVSKIRGLCKNCSICQNDTIKTCTVSSDSVCGTDISTTISSIYHSFASTAFTNEYRFPTSTTHNVTSSTSNANLNTWKIQLVLLFPVGVYIFLVSVWII